MFAIIKTGGKQYRVSANDIVRVEKLDANEGDIIELSEVLMIGEGEKVTIGAPTISGAKVKAEIIKQMRDKKVIVFKKIRRHNHRRKNGHRQELSVLRIKEIVAA